MRACTLTVVAAAGAGRGAEVLGGEAGLQATLAGGAELLAALAADPNLEVRRAGSG